VRVHGVKIAIARKAHEGSNRSYSDLEALALHAGYRASLKRFDEGDGDEKVNAE
jgi:hypothetical protein